MGRLSRAQRRLYPWRAPLTSIACEGGTINPHLPITYAELYQPDPENFPFEWSCPDCEITGPSVFWDPKVPVPPHDFFGADGDEWRCRVCLMAKSDRMWHPEPATPIFDPTRVGALDPFVIIGGWALCVEETLGVLEVYVDRRNQRIALADETYNILMSTEEAFERFMRDTAHGDVAEGMRFLHDIPVYETALRAYRKANNQDVVIAKDEITQLSDLARSLATQATSVGYDGDFTQQEILVGRYLAARQRVGQIKERLALLESELDFAAIALS